jgi:hypothetical protein
MASEMPHTQSIASKKRLREIDTMMRHAFEEEAAAEAAAAEALQDEFAEEEACVEEAALEIERLEEIEDELYPYRPRPPWVTHAHRERISPIVVPIAARNAPMPHSCDRCNGIVTLAEAVPSIGVDNARVIAQLDHAIKLLALDDDEWQQYQARKFANSIDVLVDVTRGRVFTSLPFVNVPSPDDVEEIEFLLYCGVTVTFISGGSIVPRAWLRDLPWREAAAVVTSRAALKMVEQYHRDQHSRDAAAATVPFEVALSLIFATSWLIDNLDYWRSDCSGPTVFC